MVSRVSIMIRMREGLAGNRGSIPCRDRSSFYSTVFRLAFESSKYPVVFAVVKYPVCGADHSRQWATMCGAVPPLLAAVCGVSGVLQKTYNSVVFVARHSCASVQFCAWFVMCMRNGTQEPVLWYNVL